MRAESGEDPAQMASARLDASAQLQTVADAALSLTEGDRDVLLLTAFEGASHAEIAEALDIPVGTVKSRLNRARRILRERLIAVGQYEEQAGGEVDD